MRWTGHAILTVLLCQLIGALTGYADDTTTRLAKMDPLEIVADCIAAAEERDIARYVDHLTPVKWTLYTRGDYALAVATNPVPQAPPPPCATGECAPVPSAVNAPQHQIEFRRIDGHWKIARLLPISTIMPSACAVPATLQTATWDPYAAPCPPPSRVAPATTAQYPNPPTSIPPSPATRVPPPQ